MIGLADPVTSRPRFVPIDPPNLDDLNRQDYDEQDRGPSSDQARLLLEGMVRSAEKEARRFADSSRAQTNLGMALFNREDVETAAETLLTAVELDPTNIVAWLFLGRCELALGNVVKARQALERVLSAQPGSVAARLALAEVETLSGSPNVARGLIKAAVALEPGNAQAHYELGRLFLAKHESGQAIHHFRMASRISERSAPYLYGLGVAYVARGEMAHAERAFGQALALSPRMGPALRALSKVLASTPEKDVPIELLKEHLVRHPSDHEARELLANAYCKQLDFKKARQQLYQALQELSASTRSGAHARILNNLGVCYQFLNDNSHAERFFRRASEQYPEYSPLPAQNLARLLCMNGHPDEALQVMAECVRTFPGNSTSQLVVAWALAELERYADAMLIYQELIRIGREGVTPYAYWASMATETNGDLARAEQVLEEGLTKFPNDPVLTNNLAYLYLMSDRVPAARRLLHKISDQADAAPFIAATEGLLRLREGDLTEGKAGYRRAAELARRQGHYFLARLAEQKMHVELAREYERRHDMNRARRAVENGLRSPVRSGLYLRQLRDLERSLRAAGVTSSADSEPKA